MPRRTIALTGALAATLALATPAAADYSPGAPGAGDPYYPNAGNGGYDVSHYDLELKFDRTPNRLEGDVEIDARATQNLSRFNLDLRPFMVVSKVEVNGSRASFTREGEHELVITPRKGIRKGRSSRSRSSTPARRSRCWTPTTRSRDGSRRTTARSS